MIFRVEKKDNYTVISNRCMRDMTLSLKAKGLHTLMMSLPDDWIYSVKGLAAIVRENETAVRSALKELKEAGYLSRRKQHTGGKLCYVYNIYEEPMEACEDTESLDAEKLHTENLYTENLHTEALHKENPALLNKDISNKNKINIDKSIINKSNKYKSNREDKALDSIIKGIDDIHLSTAIRDYVKMREETDRPIRASSLKLLLKKLNEMTSIPYERAAIVEQSTRNTWKDIYQLKAAVLKQ